MLDYTLKEIGNDIRGAFLNSFFGFRLIFFQDISITIKYPGDKTWFYTISLIVKNGICACQFKE
jgi:hypothetical protein